MYSILPNKQIVGADEISSSFIELGCESFHDACEFVWKLPYGRTSERANWRLVLTEKMGSCSTKHALLKALSEEIGCDIELCLGIYPMKEVNTPGVSRVLSSHKLEFIPEAHCYLKHQGERVDLTRFGHVAQEPISEFFIEVNINKDDIGEFKLGFHRDFLLKHYGRNNFRRIWSIRELCIQALCE